MISLLRGRGVEVSAAQLERWRRAGVLPRNTRRGLGRGAGSVSKVSAESVVIAEALGRAARRGRPLHETVLRVFTSDPRFDLKIFLATPRLPMPEQAVRAALAWFIRYRVNSVSRRIERAIAAASSDDEAEDIAAKLAERHYLRVSRSDRRDPNKDILTEGLRLTRQEALGHAVFAMVSFLGQEAVGSQRFADAVRDSFGYAGQYQAEVEELIRFMEAENIRRELSGRPLLGNLHAHTMDADTEAIRQVDFAAICKVRDVLALLAEAAMIYKIARESIPDDPILRRLVDFFTSSYEAHIWVRAATPLAYTAPADSWGWMASLIVMICCDSDDLGSFEEMTQRVDFTLDDIRSLVGRAAEARKERS
jgi:hypothetical protein